MDSAGLGEIGVGAASADQVGRLGRLAANAGLRGLVCSPHEVTLLRAQLPAGMQLVTPGIRPAGEAGGDDQKRVMTPAEAVAAGANYIVVGRPIIAAEKPDAAAQRITKEMAEAAA